jgi:NADH dehydrogenase FAD-containing subunit
METNTGPDRILIIGGGFGGVVAALQLAKGGYKGPITLISDRPHFEYYAGLYRLVTGRSVRDVCVPLGEIFSGSAWRERVEVVTDKIISLDPVARTAGGESGRRYTFAKVILALGAETAYFNIPGLREFSYSFKSVREALAIKHHLHERFQAAADPNLKPEDKVTALHLVVVGAGPAGVELAAGLAEYSRFLACKHKVDPQLVAIELLDAAPRILPMFPPAVSARVARQLRRLGINIMPNRAMLKEEAEEVVVRGMSLQTQTVIWTSGVTPNAFFKQIPGLTFDPRGRVVVGPALEAKPVSQGALGEGGVFVIGDGAATQYTGLAQTAIDNARFLAQYLISGKQKIYKPAKPASSVPAGRHWAVTIWGPLTLYGRLGWWLRRAADLRFFLSILPLGKALTAFRAGGRFAEACPVCKSAD